MRLAWLCLVAFESMAMGTSILIRVTPAGVLIGADSKTHTAGDAPSEETCKIHMMGGVVFANAGLIRDRYSGFDLAEIATISLSHHAAIEEGIQEFESRVSAFLRVFLGEIRGSFPAVYQSFDHNPGISVVFARMDAGRPSIHVRSFMADGLFVQVLKQDCAGQCPDAVVGLGHFSRMYEYLGAHPAAFVNRVGEDAALSQKLLQLEAASNPAEVGPPFSVLRLDAAGRHWISPGVCGSPTPRRSHSLRAGYSDSPGRNSANRTWP